MFVGQIILGYKAKYLGDYSWLSALLSHTSNPVPLRAGICWPPYLRLEETSLRRRHPKWAGPGLPSGLSQPLLRGSPSKVLQLYPQSRGHRENRTNRGPVYARDCHQGSCWVFLERGTKQSLGLALLISLPNWDVPKEEACGRNCNPMGRCGM